MLRALGFTAIATKAVWYIEFGFSPALSKIVPPDSARCVYFTVYEKNDDSVCTYTLYAPLARAPPAPLDREIDVHDPGVADYVDISCACNGLRHNATQTLKSQVTSKARATAIKQNVALTELA